jgi:hypothetical protein
MRERRAASLGQMKDALSRIETLEGGGGGTALNDLTDVTITAAVTGEVLRYNGSAWVDAALTEADISDLGDYVTVAGDTMTGDLIRNSLGTNSSPGTDSLRFGGYGIMGTRASQPVYVTNSGAGGVQINSGAVHGAGGKVAAFTASQADIAPNGAVAGTPALLVTNAGTANKIARFVGDSDGLDIETISAGDYKIRNTAQDNYITFYDGTGGVDIGYNGSIRIEMDSGNDVALYYAGVEEFHTQNSDATGNTTGAQVKVHDQTWYDVGLNLLPVQREDTSFTISALECGAAFLKDGATVRTITLEASTSTDFPVHGVMTIFNAVSTGNITVTEGAGTTLYVLDGSSRTDAAGSATVGPGGVATLWRESATIYYLFGSGVTP